MNQKVQAIESLPEVEDCPACGLTTQQHARDCWEFGADPDVREYINQCVGC